MGTDNASVARRYMTEIWGKGNLDVIDEHLDLPLSRSLARLQHCEGLAPGRHASGLMGC